MRLAGFLAFILMVPAAAHAAVLKTIVPACAYSSVVCQACDLVAMAHNILFDFVELGAMAATLMFAYAGYLYVTAAANHNNLEEAKKIFWNSLLGLVFIIGAWLIVDLALRVLMGQPLNVVADISCVSVNAVNGGFEFTPSNNPEGSVTGTAGPAAPSGCTAGETHGDAYSALTGAGITVTTSGDAGIVSGTCSGQGCTNLSGICQGTVTNLTNIARDSGCPVTITGGTETGAHKSAAGGGPHEVGRAVDLRYNQCIADWLQANSSNYGVTQICTAAAESQYRKNCTYEEGPRQLHLTF